MTNLPKPSKYFGEDVIFDKNVIRPSIIKFNYNEARRIKGPIYDAMAMELYEAGCPNAAKQFQSLADKENDLILNEVIGDRMSDEPELLNAIFENIKNAEFAANMTTNMECGGMGLTFELLYKTLVLLESSRHKFDWLLYDVYKIILKLSEQYEKINDGTSAEHIARIYYMYGCYMTRKADQLTSVMYLEKAMHMSRGLQWRESFAKCTYFTTLHTEAAKKLAKVLCKYGKQIKHVNPELAVEMAFKAILNIAEVGKTENIFLFSFTNLAYAEFLIERGDAALALKTLLDISDAVHSNMNYYFGKLQCDLFMLKGVCYTHLNDITKAQQQLQKALSMSRKYNFRNFEAETLLYMGRMLAKRHDDIGKAKEMYLEAKRMFIELGDLKKKKQVIYLLAKLKANEIFPFFMDLMKSADVDFCNYSNLRMWKNRCEPFWSSMLQNEMKMERDEIYCLLEGIE